MQPESSAPPTLDHRRAAARVEFDKWALSYDRSWINPFVFDPSRRACVEEILRWQRGRKAKTYTVLDVGCGTGRLLARLAADENATQLVGLDYSPVMVEKFAEKIAASPAPDRLTAVHADSERLPFADASFDILTCCNSFHHYPNQAAVLAEFRRVLRPRGRMILIDGFRDNVVGWVVFDVGVATVEADVHHASWRAVRDDLTAAGFDDIRQRKMNVLAPLLVSVATYG